MTEKESIHHPLHKSLAPSCVHLIGYLKSSCDKHINSLPAVPGMSVPIKIFVCLRYRNCLESWTQLISPGTAGRLSAVPGTSVPIKKNLPGTCPRYCRRHYRRYRRYHYGYMGTRLYSDRFYIMRVSLQSCHTPSSMTWKDSQISFLTFGS